VLVIERGNKTVGREGVKKDSPTSMRFDRCKGGLEPREPGKKKKMIFLSRWGGCPEPETYQGRSSGANRRKASHSLEARWKRGGRKSSTWGREKLKTAPTETRTMRFLTKGKTPRLTSRRSGGPAEPAEAESRTVIFQGLLGEKITSGGTQLPSSGNPCRKTPTNALVDGDQDQERKGVSRAKRDRRGKKPQRLNPGRKKKRGPGKMFSGKKTNGRKKRVHRGVNGVCKESDEGIKKRLKRPLLTRIG